MYNPEDYPALTYQHVVDLTPIFDGLPAVPTLSLSGLDEIEALVEALTAAREAAVEALETADGLGYPVNAGDQYVGTGVHLVVSGPGAAQLLVVASRRMRATDVPTEALATLLDAVAAGVMTPADVDEAQRKDLTPEELADAMSHALGEAATYPQDEDELCDCGDTMDHGYPVEGIDHFPPIMLDGVPGRKELDEAINADVLSLYEADVIMVPAIELGDQVGVVDARVLIAVAAQEVSGSLDTVVYRHEEDQWYQIVSQVDAGVGIVDEILWDGNGRMMYRLEGEEFFLYDWQLQRMVDQCVCDKGLDVCDGTHAVCRGID